MIIVKFDGRLGNQMFQYAFALSTSQKLGTVFLMDRLRKSILFDYFKTGYTFSSKQSNDSLIKICRKFLRKKINQDNFAEVEELKRKIKNYRYYQGFFQSEAFFDQHRALVKNRLQVRKKYINDFHAKYGAFYNQNKVIAIHCRLGDYLIYGNDVLGGKNLSLPESYYKKALQKIPNIEDYKIIIVTDDTENIVGRFDFIPEKIIVSEDEIIDFQILQNAHQVIISNSSFSWWAAYLNNKSATIYAPDYWLGFKIKREYPCSILPKTWVKVNFGTF